MQRKSFYEICQKLNPYLVKKITRTRIPILVESQFGAFLYYIINEGRYLKTVKSFGISRPSMTNIIKNVLHAIVK